MINFFRFGEQPGSHYEQQAEGPVLRIVHDVISTNAKIVRACQNLDDYAREYVPPPPLTETQQAEIQRGIMERELFRQMYDAGLWLPEKRSSSFRIRE